MSASFDPNHVTKLGELYDIVTGIWAKCKNLFAAKSEVPTKTSDLQNDSGFITSSDIPAQVQANWNETVITDPSYIQNKPSIPSKTSDLQNDSGFITASEVPNPLPSSTSADAGKVLTVDSSGDPAWQTSSGGSYTAGDAIDITNDEISVKYDGETIVQDLVPSTPINVSTVSSTYDARIEVPSDILALIKSSDESEFAISIPADTLRLYVSEGTYDLTVRLSQYSSDDSFITYLGKATVSVGSNYYLDAQTIRIKCGSGFWPYVYFNTGYLQLAAEATKVQANSTTLTTPVQFVQMVSGNGPLKVSNPLPSGGTNGQFLKRTASGQEWSNIPAQVNADWNASSGAAQILNKPTIPNYTGSGTIDVNGNVISVKYDTETLKQGDGGDFDFTGEISANSYGVVELSPDWCLRFYNGTSGQGVAQIPGMTYSIYNVAPDTAAYLAIFANSGGVYGNYMYCSSKPLSYSAVNGVYYIDAQDVVFDFPANSANGWLGTSSSLYPAYVGIIFTNDGGTNFNMPSMANSGVFKLGLYAQGVGPLAVKIPVPAFDPVSDVDKVLTVNSSGNLEWAAGGSGTQVQSNWNEVDTSSPAYIQNKPTIPSKTSDLQNDSGFITASQVPAQVQSDWNQSDSSAVDYIKNKPSIPAAQVQSDWSESVTTDPSYIQNKPEEMTLVAGTNITLTPDAVNHTLTIAASGGASYSAGNMISLANDTVAVSTTAGITDIQLVNALPAQPVATVLYLIPET